MLRPSGLRRDLAVALPPWIAARVLVGGTLVAAHALVAWLARVPEPVGRHVGQGLLGWDAERYLQIASSGYEALPRVELRFFPLLPLLTRALDPVLPGGTGAALLVIANVGALAFGMVLHRLALEETGDRALAQRAAWFAALFPAGFVLVWGYTESLWGALAAGTFLAARKQRWWAAAALGAAAGLLRPVGVLLAVPVLVEVVRSGRGTTDLRRAAPMVAAVLAPVASAASYLWWVGRTFGDPLLPFTIQQRGAFRGSPTDPFHALWTPARALLGGEVSIATLRVGWAVVLVALVVVVWRRWPLSHAVFATLLLLVALSTSRLGSFERYGFTTFPVLLALATIGARPSVDRLLLVGGSAALGLYGFLALIGVYVP